MFLLMPHRNNRQMRVVRLDAKANKRKIADTFDGKEQAASVIRGQRAL
jgi:hypothetical protein